jgi:uncharacterized membrane-anchored protein YhcB (DUF1043 family)
MEDWKLLMLGAVVGAALGYIIDRLRKMKEQPERIERRLQFIQESVGRDDRLEYERSDGEPM